NLKVLKQRRRAAAAGLIVASRVGDCQQHIDLVAGQDESRDAGGNSNGVDRDGAHPGRDDRRQPAIALGAELAVHERLVPGALRPRARSAWGRSVTPDRPSPSSAFKMAPSGTSCLE